MKNDLYVKKTYLAFSVLATEFSTIKKLMQEHTSSFIKILSSYLLLMQSEKKRFKQTTGLDFFHGKGFKTQALLMYLSKTFH